MIAALTKDGWRARKFLDSKTPLGRGRNPDCQILYIFCAPTLYIDTETTAPHLATNKASRQKSFPVPAAWFIRNDFNGPRALTAFNPRDLSGTKGPFPTV